MRFAAGLPRHSVLAFALVNAVLYCCLLPLWEGFDEPFHYGYVENIAVWHEFPVMNKARISGEIRESLRLVPLSRLLSDAIPGSVSFEDWSRLPEAEKLRRIQELRALDPALRRESSDVMNYEAQQAPLAYLLLAPVDMLARNFSLRTAMLLLRLLGAITATVLLYAALTVLLRELGLDERFQWPVLACVFESQMLWASIAHVGNDWLAVPLTLFFLTWLAAATKTMSARNTVVLSLIFSAGLLTKAYFLVFVPLFVALIFYQRSRLRISWKTVAVALAIPVVIDGPWYAHNVLLYGSLSGTQQSMAGIGALQVLAAVPHINWLKSATDFARWSLWTGNWSFLSFSRSTLNFEAILLCLSFLLYLVRRGRSSEPERWILAGCGCFVLGVAYQTCATWIHTGGVSTNAEPWYWQGVLPCIWVLCFLGLQASGTAGRTIAMLLGLIAAWIAELTYVAKLLPYYGGVNTRGTWHNVMNWWLSNPSQGLKSVTLAPVWVVYGLLALFSCMLVFITAVNVRGVWAKD